MPGTSAAEYSVRNTRKITSAVEQIFMYLITKLSFYVACHIYFHKHFRVMVV